MSKNFRVRLFKLLWEGLDSGEITKITLNLKEGIISDIQYKLRKKKVLVV